MRGPHKRPAAPFPLIGTTVVVSGPPRAGRQRSLIARYLAQTRVGDVVTLAIARDSDHMFTVVELAPRQLERIQFR